MCTSQPSLGVAPSQQSRAGRLVEGRGGPTATPVRAVRNRFLLPSGVGGDSTPAGGTDGVRTGGRGDRRRSGGNGDHAARRSLRGLSREADGRRPAVIGRRQENVRRPVDRGDLRTPTANAAGAGVVPGVRGGAAPRQPPQGTHRVWPQGVSGSPEAQITAGDHVSLIRTARSAIPAAVLDPAGPCPNDRKTGIICRELPGIASACPGTGFDHRSVEDVVLAIRRTGVFHPQPLPVAFPPVEALVAETGAVRDPVSPAGLHRETR